MVCVYDDTKLGELKKKGQVVDFLYFNLIMFHLIQSFFLALVSVLPTLLYMILYYLIFF